MALKLPKRSVAVASDKDEGKLSDNANPATLIDLETAHSGFSPLSDAPNTATGAEAHDNNLTFIGDVLEQARDIKLPLIGHMALQRQIRILFISMFVLLALGGLFVYLNSSQKFLASIQNQIAGDALMHSQRIGKAAPNAIQGKPEAFKELEESQAELNADLNVLIKGGNYKGDSLSSARAADLPVLNDGAKIWSNTDKAAETILKLKKELTGFGQTLEKLNSISPVLLELTEEVSAQKLQGGGSAREISASGQLVMLTQRLGRSASEFLTSEGVNPETAFLLGKDTNTFRDLVDGFLNGSDVLKLTPTKDADTRAKLTELKTTFAEYQASVSTLLGNLQNFIAAKQAEQLVFTENEDLRMHLISVQKVYRDHLDSTGLSFYLMLFFFMLSLVPAFGIAAVLLQDSRNRAKEANARRIEADIQMIQETMESMFLSHLPIREVNRISSRT